MNKLCKYCANLNYIGEGYWFCNKLQEYIEDDTFDEICYGYKRKWWVFWGAK